MTYTRIPLLNRSLLALMLASVSLLAAAQQSEIDVWQSLLKPKYFKDIELADGAGVIELITPYRAEDAALTPVTVKAKIPQTKERYIERIWLFVEGNPQPHVGTFHMTPAVGRADLAMRIRIDKYTNVRAVAALNTGEHFIATNFVKAQGGCSAPLGSDLEAAMKRIGRMRFRTVGEMDDSDLLIGQLNISHPNITGMQLDQRTRLFHPAHYVKQVRLTMDDELLMEAETGFSVSEDPSFRFFFKPHKNGVIKADVIDSKGMEFTEEFKVKI